MPMLITLRMRLRGVAFPRAAPHPVREVGHPVEHGVHLGHHVLAVDDDRRALRRAQRDVQDRAVLRHVDLLAAEHGVDPRAQAGLLGELDEQPQRLVGDAVLRVVEVDAGGFRGQAFAAPGIVREELPQMHAVDRRVMGLERLPHRARGHRLDHCGHPRVPFALRPFVRGPFSCGSGARVPTAGIRP